MEASKSTMSKYRKTSHFALVLAREIRVCALRSARYILDLRASNPVDLDQMLGVFAMRCHCGWLLGIRRDFAIEIGQSYKQNAPFEMARPFDLPFFHHF